MRPRWLAWLLLLAVVCLALASFSAGEGAGALKGPVVFVVAPLQEVIGGSLDTLSNAAGIVSSLSTLAEDNRYLRQRVDELQSEVVRLREAGSENEELRALLQYERDNPGRDYHPATIVGSEPNNLSRSITINRGADDGVRRGMVVVTYLGLVGKVVEVFPRASRVLLITDPSGVVNGVVPRSRVEGVLTGRPDQKLNMEYVPKDADIQPGDLVITSGLGGGFPRALLIGRVELVATNDQNLFKTVLVEAAVRPPLRAVLVIKDFTPIDLMR